MLVGVDEAGRGPVLGSMFVAAVAVSDTDVLPAGVRDSKTLDEAKRETIAKAIESSPATCGIVEVTTTEIDDPDRDLNQLTIDASARAIRDAVEDVRSGTYVIADACDVNPSRYAARLAQQLPKQATIDASHGADNTEPIVSAASIIAKCRRESHVDQLHAKFGTVGSGYPSDPHTRAFLTDYVDREGELPACARRSWQTSRDILNAAGQGTLRDF